MALAPISAPVEELAAQLRERYRPTEVILFGSRSHGRPRQNSDADFLLIFGDGSQGRARGFFFVEGKTGLRGHVHAYSVRSLRSALVHGNTAVRDALAVGVLLYPSGDRSRYAHLQEEWSTLAAARDWLTKAKADLQAAKLVAGKVASNPALADHVAFLSQQTAEKALKAIIQELGKTPARTHDLTHLLTDLVKIDPAVGARLEKSHRARAARLEPYAVQVRYPGPGTSPVLARKALADAQAILRDAEKLVP